MQKQYSNHTNSNARTNHNALPLVRNLPYHKTTNSHNYYGCNHPQYMCCATDSHHIKNILCLSDDNKTLIQKSIFKDTIRQIVLMQI